MEAFMAGCVPASDIPFEMEELLSPAIIHLSPQWSLSKINRIIQKALENPIKLKQMAAHGLYLARTYFSCEHKVERMLNVYKEYQQEFRGYYFPFGYRMGCHSYLKGFETPNAWCRHPISVLLRIVFTILIFCIIEGWVCG